MSDLIDRDSLKKAIGKVYGCDWDYVDKYFHIAEAVNSLPSTESERTAKAEMLEEPFRTSMTWEGKCSNCGCYTIHEMNYCFGCGAKLYWG